MAKVGGGQGPYWDDNAAPVRKGPGDNPSAKPRSIYDLVMDHDSNGSKPLPRDNRGK